MNQFSKIEYTVTIEDISMKLSIDRFAAINNELVALTKHTHAYSELFVCVSGQLRLEIEDKIITLGGGDAVLIPANLWHHKLIENTETVWCAVGFLITVNRRRSAAKLSKSLHFWCGTEARILCDVPEFCGDIYRLRTAPLSANDCIPAMEFTLLLLKYAETFADFSHTDVSVPHDSDMNRIAVLENLVNAEFMTDITPRAVSELLHISTRQLSRIVKKRYGTTFTRVILDKRLETAAKLLIETDRTVESVADAVGFSSVSFMHHAFKAKYDMTPIAYRHSKRN